MLQVTKIKYSTVEIAWNNLFFPELDLHVELALNFHKPRTCVELSDYNENYRVLLEIRSYIYCKWMLNKGDIAE